MLKFVLRKMLSKKWMVLALLVGNILLVGITSSNPMYTNAVLQRTLMESMQEYLQEENAYPGLAMIRTNGRTKEASVVAGYAQAASGFGEAYGLPEVESFAHYSLNSSKAVLESLRSDYSQQYIALDAMGGLPGHSAMIDGRMYANGVGEGNLIEAVASKRTLVQLNLMVGDTLVFPTLKGEDGNPLRVQIVGAFTNSSAEDGYWINPPNHFTNNLFIHPDVFESHFMQVDENGRYATPIGFSWYVMMDYTVMRTGDVERILSVSDTFDATLNSVKETVYFDHFTDVLKGYTTEAMQVTVTMWVLQIPIFALLAAFIFMVARQMTDMEQSEIAVIRSRGAGKSQILRIYLIQSVLIAVLSLIIGLPLAYLICQVIGSANAFLEFVSRGLLPVEVTADTLIFAGASALLSVLAMVLPAMKHAKATIVGAKRRKQRKGSMPMWQKLGLDIILLAVSLYGLYTFNGQKAQLAARAMEDGMVDPLTFLSSSLFMVGAALFAVRITPMIVWLIYRAFRRLWSPALYASFLQVLRSKGSQTFIMVFLIMTIALGVFNAQAARTINQNAEDNLRYNNGAQAVVEEVWQRNYGATLSSGEPAMTEPDFGRFEALDGAASLAKVYVNQNVTAALRGGNIKGVTLMAVHTKDFGETAWMKDSLLDVHWYHYLNAMAGDSRAVLVSSNFRENHNCRLGDSIAYTNESGIQIRGTIYGFVDYFPGYAQFTYGMGTDGVVREQENYLIVANLQQVQSSYGVLPYQVWIRHKGDASYLYDFIDASGVKLVSFTDTESELVAIKNDPVLQGTNGVLTVGFMVVLVLCLVGFLIFWILSIRARSLQFGIFRAMGMSMREVFSMLINEQLFISGISIGVGALVGNLTSRLYMPLIQLAYSSADNALPLEVINLAEDNIRLFVVVGGVMLLCLVVLGVMISRMKIAQALKMGED